MPEIRFITTDQIAEALARGGKTLMFIVIDRQHIERCEIHSTLDRLLRLSNVIEHVRIAYQSCELLLSGYDDDPRELPAIPEVRRFFAALTARWPNWWYFATPGTRLLIHALHIEAAPLVAAAGRAYLVPDRASLQAYVTQMTKGTHALFAEHRLSPASLHRLLEEVAQDLPNAD